MRATELVAALTMAVETEDHIHAISLLKREGEIDWDMIPFRIHQSWLEIKSRAEELITPVNPVI